MQALSSTIALSPDRPTGNFWVDTGLVVLLERFGEGQHPVRDVLDWLLSQLVQRSGNKGEYYDPATGQIREYDKVNWIYPANLFIKISGQAPKVAVREVLEELRRKLDSLESSGNPNSPAGEQLKADIEYLSARLWKNKDDRIFTEPPKFKFSLALSKKPDTCDLCGDSSPLTDATMRMYPFVVDPQKFGTFYPGTKRGLKLCARCALAGLAGYLGWLWKAQGRDALHFFIFYSDLREMLLLHREVLEPLRIRRKRGGTAPVAFAGPYLHETMLGLLLKLFQHVRSSDRLSDEARELLAMLLGASTSAPPAPITLYAITGTITGTRVQVFKMQALREFSKLQQLYQLYEKWLDVIAIKVKDPNPHKRLVKVLSQFRQQQEKSIESIWHRRGRGHRVRRRKQGKSIESIWRDKIAWAILEFGDPLPFIEQFLFEARAKENNPRPLVRGTIAVLNHYLREVLGMDEQFQRTLAGFGHSLGTAAQEHNEMGLLYALRNAKNPEDFYRVLNDAQFRLQVTVPEALLRIERGERIAGAPWVRVKTLLSIYAMNAFLRKGASQAEEVTTTQEDQP